ncbi:selenocysteine-specific translation elongation factor [Herbidospora sp. NBRC 101105]|uniref:selenocysteine-specific translation elongation factor n=1 Tax=Herbidospora sp. NBRC 101105 TaxID=3032195 RepID=UPI0024A4E294|nr:selenocysteine-specific translation elongation factor [Herbidospora sp. NBRC 101105]GLX99573.1 selenocysteine-specific translation elongation factor [Herbidospora sp. NBRC 101105]
MHVVATAGHVDHGKSTLVRALTGMEPDRWAEERRRGLTIDLGFAWRTMPSGRALAFVDVPGHERFVTNMMAGIGPVPAVLIVVAADEGWMPQSAEHLAVIDALGVHHGLLVVTRSDRGDAELAIEEARLELADSSLADVPAVAVSSITGAGIDDLVTALDELVASLPAPDDAAPVRLWIDRAFTIKGMGTVVTGTLPAGTVNVGDELQLSPSGRIVKIRGMESLKRKVETVTGVARVALNLKGVDLDECQRGMALVTPGRWSDTDTVDVRLRAGTSDLLPRESLLHIGSASVSVRIRRLGETTARLTLEHPLPLHVGDRVILRDPGSRRVTGLTVLDVRPPPFRRRGAAVRAADELAEWPDPPTAHQLLARHHYLKDNDFSLMGLRAVGRGVDGDWRVDPGWWVSQCQRLSALAKDYALGNPLAPTLPVEVARQLLDLPDRRLVEALVRPPLRIEAGRIHRPADRPKLPEAIAAAVRRLERELEETPFQAPEAGRLAQLGLDSRAAIAAAKVGAVLRLAEGVVLPLTAEPRAVEILGDLPQPFTASEARSALGTSRRVVIPLLEYLDERGHTVRVDNSSRRMRTT